MITGLIWSFFLGTKKIVEKKPPGSVEMGEMAPFCKRDTISTLRRAACSLKIHFLRAFDVLEVSLSKVPYKKKILADRIFANGGKCAIGKILSWRNHTSIQLASLQISKESEARS